MDDHSEPNWSGAVGLGLAAAMLGGLVWGVAANLTGYRLALVAIFIGWMVGTAVVRGSGNQRGPGLQVLSVALTLAGIAVGVFAEVHAMLSHASASGSFRLPPGLGPWETSFLTLPVYLTHEMGGISLLIVAFGLYQAWRQPAEE